MTYNRRDKTNNKQDALSYIRYYKTLLVDPNKHLIKHVVLGIQEYVICITYLLIGTQTTKVEDKFSQMHFTE